MFEVVKAEAAQAAPWVFDNDDDDESTGSKAWPRVGSSKPSQQQRASRNHKGGNGSSRGGGGGGRGGFKSGPRSGPKRGPGGKLKPAFGRPG
jgi:hypothetical protein